MIMGGMYTRRNSIFDDVSDLELAKAKLRVPYLQYMQILGADKYKHALNLLQATVKPMYLPELSATCL